jgi:hypothetical protein
LSGHRKSTRNTSIRRREPHCKATARGDNHTLPIRKDLTKQQGGVIRLSNPITKEGASNAHRAKSMVGCILGITSTGNQIALSAGNLDISQGIVGFLLTTKPTRIAQRDKEPQHLLECMLCRKGTQQRQTT